MAYELQEGKFKAFKNNHKEKQEHPDLTGQMLVNGKPTYINVWYKDKDGKPKKDKNGNFFISGSVRAKGEKPSAAKVYNTPVLPGQLDNLDDSEAPF